MAASSLATSELPSPLTLRLPFWLGRDFSLKRLLARTSRQSWNETWPLVQAFSHSRPERQFAKTLLRYERRWWLFRCHQRGFCGDFVIVDMSPPAGQSRLAAVIELKTSAPLTIGGGGASNQFKNHQRAFEDVQSQLKHRGTFRPELISGDNDHVMNWLRAR